MPKKNLLALPQTHWAAKRIQKIKQVHLQKNHNWRLSLALFPIIQVCKHYQGMKELIGPNKQHKICQMETKLQIEMVVRMS